MKKNINKFIALTSLSFAFFFFASCSEDITPSLTELVPGSLPAPVIDSIAPPLEALAGITKLTITGSNFSVIKEKNSVYFNGKPGIVLSSTTTQLEVVSAVVIADTVIVKVAVTGAEQFSNNLLYKLKTAVTELYKFANPPATFPYAVTIDELENLYVSVSGEGTKKIDPQGNLSDYSLPGTTATVFFTSMAFVDNSLYAVNRKKGVYKVSENTNPAVFVASGISEFVNCINYDKSRGVLWAGANNGTIFRITLGKDVKKFNAGGNFNAIKIAQNTIYAAATYDSSEVIWKIPIVSADSLGLPELFFNATTEIDSIVKITNVVVSEDGDIYIGTNKEADPIYIIHPDKSFEILYPGILNSAVYSLVWGNDKYLYMSNVVKSVNTTVLKIDMQKLGSQ